MKRSACLFILLQMVIVMWSVPTVTLEEVVLQDFTTRLEIERLIAENSKCFSLDIAPYYAFDYYPSTLARNEFYINIFPADLTAKEMQKLGYYIVLQGIPFVLPRNIPQWFYQKTGNTRSFSIMFDREQEEKDWQRYWEKSGIKKDDIAPVIDDREHIRYIPWILLRGENRTLKYPLIKKICYCGKY